MPAILEKLKAKLNPSAAREAARVHDLHDAIKFYRSAVHADALGESYDVESAGEAMAKLALTDEHWQGDVAVDCENNTLPDERAWAAELDRLNKAVANGPGESITVTKGWLNRFIREKRKPAEHQTLLAIPKHVTEMMEQLSSAGFKLQAHIDLGRRIKNFRRLNPRLFSDDLTLAAQHKGAAVTLREVDRLQNQPADIGNSATIGATREM